MSCKGKNDAIKKGQITGYFGLVQLGRPKKVQESNNTQQPISAEVTRSNFPNIGFQWNSEELFPVLKASVLAKFTGQDLFGGLFF